MTTESRLRPAIERTRRQSDLALGKYYDSRGRYREPRRVPYWIGACLLVGAWAIASVVL